MGMERTVRHITRLMVDSNQPILTETQPSSERSFPPNAALITTCVLAVNLGAIGQTIAHKENR